MERLKRKIAQFMQGRYGIDQLYIAMLILYFILLAFNRRIHNPYFGLLLWLLIVVAIYRVFSKNISKRYVENQQFLKFWRRIKNKLSLTVKRLADVRTHRYRKCPNCQTVLRLPRKRGVHRTKCPRCTKRFQVKVRF
ncbi:zf-TFIIB domain-containing protein [Amphibacillus jilinensis]|uniref:zf-TFIIB domain-containing protein n=1 Tax=Amphibacillus jilinensis TaxID=1216008 RepID=UPI0002D9F32C|nr:zf-TFIIB domain-containing protein [Amphibacillus jilinensis]